MRLLTIPVTLKKRYPLRISRGVIAENHNLWVGFEYTNHDENPLVGLGEMASGGGLLSVSPLDGANQIKKFWDDFKEKTQHPSKEFPNIYEMWQEGFASLTPPVYAAIDIALWDLLAKRANMSLWKLLGLSPTLPPTSVTIGINPPEIQRERVKEILERTRAKIIKVKLGSSEGIDADKAAFRAIQEAISDISSDSGYSHRVSPQTNSLGPYQLRVDANGGWGLNEAITMLKYLSEHGVQFVEQPLSVVEEDGLPHLFKSRPLPIFVDESCQTSLDVPRLAPYVDGVVVKLMKSGGITEAMRIVATARAHRLKTMIGCMGESSIAISAGASIASLFDYVDLDSHLNLLSDPASGPDFDLGFIRLNESIGHGASINHSSTYHDLTLWDRL